MSPIPPSLEHSFLAKQVGTMALSQVISDNPMMMIRAASWFNSVTRLGIHLPLFLIHDIGCLFTMQGSNGYLISSRRGCMNMVVPPQNLKSMLSRYQSLLEILAASEVVHKLSAWRLKDDLVSVLLTRVLSDTYQRWPDRTKSVGTSELPLDLGLYSEADYGRHFKAFEEKKMWDFLIHLCEDSLHIQTSCELIDLDTVRLLGIFKEDNASGADSLGSSLDLVDLFSALDSPEASDIASFSLDLLPSVLETKKSSGAQSFSVDGYASLERKGNIDSLMLSELAYDDDIFEQKVVDQELLYFGHEREREDERRLHYILVDSSASMRGKRQVFGRGLALTLVKKLALQGDEIWLRFFDSRLHDIVKVTPGKPFPVPYLLSFRSECGRNYGKVFRQFQSEMTKLKNEHHRNVVVYLITHGQCHIAPELIAGLAPLAFLYGIIILPSSELELEFLPLLDRQQIVESDTFSSRVGRKDRALHIIDDATENKLAEG